jgi:putative transcriptional regulator
MTAPYHYTECGLDNVYLLNGFRIEDTSYGPAISIEDTDGLHHAIALDLVLTKRMLSGKELRFLRRELDLSQEALGLLLGGYQAQTVARWEKGECDTAHAADRLLRLVYLAHAHDNPDVRKVLDLLKDLDILIHEERVFEETDQGWRYKAA